MNIIKTDLLSEIDFIEHGFFDRTDGVSEGEYESLNVALDSGDSDKSVLKNREKIAAVFETKISNMIMLNQQHGTKVHVIDSKNLDEYKFKNPEQSLSNKGDSIITNQKGVLIGVSTADCAPILLCDLKEKYIGVIHAGWKGAIGKIIENTIEKMKSLKCKDIVAAIGPCLQKRYFEVDYEIIDQVDKRYLISYGDKTLFDMQFLILEKLMKLGVKSVSKLNIDTISNENFFSYRRQGRGSGRQFSGIMLK
jgi:YfiH family protein